MTDINLALLGGALIGLSATLLLWSTGQVAGVSGMLGTVVDKRTNWPTKLAFVLGLVAVGVVAGFVAPARIGAAGPRWMVIVGGLLVGFGTRLGNGCTSGHGICGISRGSRRSIAATMMFVATGIVAVTVTRLILGGGS